MRTTATARYARWSGAVAVSIALIVTGLYVRRDWQVRQTVREMPAAVPASVQQQSAGFSFSKVEGDHTNFTIRASRATEYSKSGRSLLEDVWVTLYGRAGDRLDNLRTQSCEYATATGDISCAGKVQIDLQSADDARLHPGLAGHTSTAARIIHVDTSGIVFNQKTGSAQTDQPVAFRFPQGTGRGVGFRYDSEQGQIHLLHDVELTFRSQSQGSATLQNEADAGELSVTGSSLIYFRDERRLHLLGPLSAHQGARDLSAQELDLEFDSELHPRTLVASGNPVLREAVPGSVHTLAADQISAAFSTDGWLESSVAEGNVHATAHSLAREDLLEAKRAQLAFASTNRPQRLTATGSVRVQSVLPDGGNRQLETSEIVLDFARSEQRGALSIEHVKTPAATLDFHGRTTVSGQSVPEHIHMTSQHLDANLGEGNLLQRILGGGGVEVQRQIGDQPLQISASREMAAGFAPDGEWSTVDQSGDVRLTQVDRSASADRAHFDHASDTVALAGSVVLADSRTRTTAQSALLRQGVHELRAEGRVVSNDISAANSIANLGPGPARISADHMIADTATGHAIYTGGARLWQGDSLVQSNTIELDHATETIVATGHVHAVFPQARWTSSGPSAANKTSAEKNEYWHTEAQRMTYDSKAGRGHLEGEARADSDEGTIYADLMDLFFSPVDSGGGAIVPVSATRPSGVSQGAKGGNQLVRATADGHVIVDQEDRHGTGNHADYTPEAGKIVLSGGPPVIHDSSGNATTGRQLTYYFRDDTIQIDSAEGNRTLTMHRVEK